MAWINDLLVGLFLTNGPSLLVRACWNPLLPSCGPPCSATKLNEDNPYTKAYYFEEHGGLHLQVEFVVHTEPGLTDKQLLLSTSLAVHTVLMGIDALAVELGHPGPVACPE